jgi:hypothetical protein
MDFLWSGRRLTDDGKVCPAVESINEGREIAESGMRGRMKKLKSGGKRTYPERYLVWAQGKGISRGSTRTRSSSAFLEINPTAKILLMIPVYNGRRCRTCRTLERFSKTAGIVSE